MKWTSFLPGLSSALCFASSHCSDGRIYWVWHVYKSRPWVLENCWDADSDPAANDDIGYQ